MNRREKTFLEEKEKCKGPFYHIHGTIKDPALIEIDRLYGIADYLSIKNAKKHKRILFSLAGLGTLLSVIFFLYFEGEQHFMIVLCVLLLILLIFVQKKSNDWECHRKYLEYRVLAESIRLQFFLSTTQIEKTVTDIMPWFIKQSIPWIENILKSLPIDEVKEKESLVYFWIRDQKTYHEEALNKAEIKKKKEQKISKIAIIVTALAFLFGLLFEIYMYLFSPNIDAHIIRLCIKIAIGGMSVGTLFLESYYGKMSLTETINDHKRMILLYKKAERDILEKGETEEIVLNLAKEYLSENSAWYAYQSKNKSELVL